MVKLFLGISLLSSLISYMNMDAMKSSFFLIISLLILMPVMSFGVNVWFSYFISLLFLSGIFVILVYFSSLSSFNKSSVYLVLFTLLLSGFVMNFGFMMKLQNNLGLSVFYYKLFWFVLIFVMFVLLFFMNFTSYFLNFSGALRKV